MNKLNNKRTRNYFNIFFVLICALCFLELLMNGLPNYVKYAGKTCSSGIPEYSL